MTVERAINIQSFRTPATRMVTAPVLPITKKMEKFRANAQRALEKKIHKLNWICETCISGFSSKYQGTNRKTKLHMPMCQKVRSMFPTPINGSALKRIVHIHLWIGTKKEQTYMVLKMDLWKKKKHSSKDYHFCSPLKYTFKQYKLHYLELTRFPEPTK